MFSGCSVSVGRPFTQPTPHLFQLIPSLGRTSICAFHLRQRGNGRETGGEEGGLPWPSRFPFPSSGSEPWLHRDLLGRLKKLQMPGLHRHNFGVL